VSKAASTACTAARHPQHGCCAWQHDTSFVWQQEQQMLSLGSRWPGGRSRKTCISWQWLTCCTKHGVPCGFGEQLELNTCNCVQRHVTINNIMTAVIMGFGIPSWSPPAPWDE
jgi:hypothetical protein